LGIRPRTPALRGVYYRPVVPPRGGIYPLITELTMHAGPIVLALAVALAPLTATTATAQSTQRQASAQECTAAERPYCAELEQLMRDPVVRKALEHAKATDGDALEDLIMLTQVPAPPFKEDARGRKYAE